MKAQLARLLTRLRSGKARRQRSLCVIPPAVSLSAEEVAELEATIALLSESEPPDDDGGPSGPA
jgi:hypothetical protein